MKRITAITGMALAIVVALGAGEVPYGHPDFHPSPKRPIGFAGDGNSYYPGASPVYEFWEGRPRQVTVSTAKLRYPGRDRNEGVETWDCDPDPTTAKNILWKTPTHSWGNSGPIRVGDKVLTLSEPSTLECFDAETGRQLWVFDGNPWLAKGVDPSAATQCWDLYQIYLACPRFSGWSTVGRGMVQHEWKKLLPILRDTVCPRLVKALLEIDPEGGYQEAADATVAAIEEILSQYEKAKDPQKLKIKDKSANALYNHIRKRIHAISGAGRKPTIRLGYSWQHEVGNMTAPVSDGERVYFETARLGGIYCVDLNGELVWQRHIPCDLRTTSNPPVLAAGVYLSMLEKGQINGLDAATGRPLWKAPIRSPKLPEKAKTGQYNHGTQAIVELANDTMAMPVIVTKSCAIVRISDGKTIGHLPWPSWLEKIPGCSTPNHTGNLVQTRQVVFALTLVDADTVTTEVIAELPDGVTYPVMVAADGYFINPGLRGGIYTPHGATLYDQGKVFQDKSNILAGTRYFSCAGNGHGLAEWKSRRSDGRAFVRFSSFDLTDPGRPLQLSDRCLLGGDAFPAMPPMQKYTPELYADPWYTSSTWGKPAHRLNSDNSITAHGDKLYIRTVDALYCIGPAIKGTPADDPQVVATIRAAGDAAALQKYLTAPSAQYRYEAVRRLADQKLVDGNAALIEQLTVIAKEDDYQEVRAAALVALGLEDDQPGSAMVEALIVAGISGKKGRLNLPPQANAVLYELGAAMEPVLLRMLHNDEKNDRFGNNPLVQAAATICTQFGLTGDALRDQLLARMRQCESFRNGRMLMVLASALGNYASDPTIVEYFAGLDPAERKTPHASVFAYLFKAAADDGDRLALIERYQDCYRQGHGRGHVFAHIIRQSLDHAAVQSWVLEQAKAGNTEMITALHDSDMKLYAQKLQRRVLAEGSTLGKALTAIYQLGNREHQDTAMGIVEETLGQLEGGEQAAALNLLAGRANRTPRDCYERIYTLVIPHLGGPATPAILGALDRFGPKISKPALPRLKELDPEVLKGDRRAPGVLKNLIEKLEE